MDPEDWKSIRDILVRSPCDTAHSLGFEGVLLRGFVQQGYTPHSKRIVRASLTPCYLQDCSPG